MPRKPKVPQVATPAVKQIRFPRKPSKQAEVDEVTGQPLVNITLTKSAQQDVLEILLQKAIFHRKALGEIERAIAAFIKAK